MKVLIVPDHLINPIGHKIQVMVGFSGGEEKIDFSILVLQDDLCSIFIGEYSEDRVVWLMLHDHIFILDVIIFQPRGVIQIYEEDLCYEKLYDLSISFDREHFLLSLLVFDLDEVQFVLVIEKCSPSIAYLDPLYRVLALDLIHFLASRNQHLVS